MEDYQLEELVVAMSDIRPDIATLANNIDQGTEAIACAMSSVKQFDGPRWFGPIGDGTFYADLAGFQWLPDTRPAEAMFAIGESLTDGLDYLDL